MPMTVLIFDVLPVFEYCNRYTICASLTTTAACCSDEAVLCVQRYFSGSCLHCWHNLTE